MARPSDRERFDSKWALDSDTGCHVWSAYRGREGYGSFRLNGGARQAHRVSYEWAHGSTPEGLVLDHLCRNRACVNPQHLEPVTQRENVRRSALGFALTGRCQSGKHEATSIRVTINGDRACRACIRDHYTLHNADISKAVKATGMTYRAYNATYGASSKVAREIVEQLAPSAHSAVSS